MAHILSMLSGREALWQQRRDRAHARQFLRVTHNFSTVNASGTPPGSPMNIFGVNRAPGGAGEEENEFLWNCDIPGEGKGLTLSRQGCRDGKGVNISGSYGQTIDSCGEKLV